MTARSICSVRGVRDCGGEGGGGRGAGHLDRHAEMNVLANPNPDTEILWSRVDTVVLPPPPLTLGRVDGGSRKLVGRRAVLGTGGNSAL